MKLSNRKRITIFPNLTLNNELRELAINALKCFKDTFIIAVDDASPEDCSFLYDYADVVIRNTKNLGFARTVNKGIRFALEQGESYIIIATNDIEIYDIDALLEPFELFDNVGFTGLPQSRDKGEAKNFSEPLFTDGGLWKNHVISGGILASKSEVFRDIGLYDEDFKGVVYEDFDLLLRARDAGYRLVMSGKSMIWHKDAATRSLLKEDNLYQNKKRFEKKWGFPYIAHRIWKQEILNGKD